MTTSQLTALCVVIVLARHIGFKTALFLSLVYMLVGIFAQ